MKSPAFQFYPTDYLASQRVQMMTLEEEGAYCRLLWSCWQHGSIPSDPELAARLVGKGCSTTVARVVLPMFEVGCGEGRLTHDRLESERRKQNAWREKSSEGGRKSAEMRQTANGGSTTLPTVVQPPYQPKGNIPTPSPTPINTKTGRFAPPSFDEAMLEASKQGLPRVEVEKFMAYYESNGWKVGKNPMKRWQGSMSGWRVRWEQNGRTGVAPQQPTTEGYSFTNEELMKPCADPARESARCKKLARDA